MHRSYGSVLNDAAREKLQQLDRGLRQTSWQDTNFALFAFRGFFYQQLAQMASVSYVPHSWRADLINSALSTQRVSFIQYVQSLTADLRSELAHQ